MTTTNGTRAILLGSGGARCLVGSFLNAGASAAELLAAEADVLLLCAGREGRFALEDAVCAGVIARELRRRLERSRIEMNDAARAALLLAQRFAGRLPSFLPRTAAGRHLVRLGRHDEIEFCATLDRYDTVPRVQDRRITL
jgi:2-phosphosulfolactate phosphatase